MKFITPSYRILSENFTRDNVLKTIAKAARTCYQSEPKGEDGDVKLMLKLINLGHEAMIEHGPDLQVSLITCRGVTHEIVRNRLFSFAQESTRYVKYGKPDANGIPEPMLFMLPPWIDDLHEREVLLNNEWTFGNIPDNINEKYDLRRSTVVFIHSMANAERDYAELIQLGWQPQQARETLPNALKTEIVIKGNPRQWRHFFELRCNKPAHPQMREWTIQLFNQLRTDIPELWDDVAQKIDLT